MNNSAFFILGKHAVIEALKNPNRKVLRIFLSLSVFVVGVANFIKCILFFIIFFN